MISLKKLQKLDMDLFESNKLESSSMYKITGGSKTSWRTVSGNKSGTDTYDCETRITNFDEPGHPDAKEDLNC